MAQDKAAPTDIDSYIASQPPSVQKILKKIRATIRKAAPKASETFKYRIPTYEQNGHLIFFAAARQHVGLYPRTKGIDALPEVAQYASGRGTVRFAFAAPIPYPLITKMVQIRVAENMAEPGRGAKARKGAQNAPAKKARAASKVKASKKTPAKKASRRRE